MADAERALYDKFVTRTLYEVQVGLELDNQGDGSLKKRVHDALVNRTNDGVKRSPAQKVIDSRFILGGDDACYLASGLAVLWSTVGNGAPHGQEELGLAPAALYSPDAVNGIRRGLIAALERRNKEMRTEAPNMIASLMSALVPLLPFIYKASKDDEQDMLTFLGNGKVQTVEQRNKLFAFLVRAKSAIDEAEEGEMPTSRLASQIIKAALSRTDAAYAAIVDNLREELQQCTALLKAEKKKFAAAAAKAAAYLRGIQKKHKAEVAKLQQELQTKKVEEQKLQAKFYSLQKKSNDCTDELELTEAELTVVQNDVSELNTQLANKQSAYELKVAELSASGRLVAKLQAKLEEKQAELDAHVAKGGTLQEQAAAQKAAVEELWADLADLGEERDAHEEAMKAAQEQTRVLEAKLSKATTELEQLRLNFAMVKTQLTEQRTESTRELRACEKKRDALSDEKADLEQQLAEAKNSSDSTSAALRARAQATQNLLDETMRELASLKEKCDAEETRLNAELTLCREEVAKKEGELEQTRAEAKACGDATTAISQEMQQLLRQATAARDTLAADLRELGEAKRIVDEALVACEKRANEQGAASAKEIGQLRNDLRLAQEAEMATRENLQKLQASIKEHKKLLADKASKSDAQLAKNVNALERAVQEARKWHKQAKLCQMELPVVKKELQDAKSDGQQREYEKRQTYEAQRDQNKAELQRAESELAVLVGELDAIRERAQVLQDELDDPTNEMDAADRSTKLGEIQFAEQEIETLEQDSIPAVQELIETTKALFELAEARLEQMNQTNYVPFPTTNTGASDDAWINTAIMRGLVGQRGPTEPAAVGACAADALLPYALPHIGMAAKHLRPAYMLLQSTPDPTKEDVDAATAACAACEHTASADGAKRQRLSQCAADLASPAVASEALALFGDDFAIMGETPAASLPAERCGVEMPHEVRWMPQGPRGASMARVAVLEHAIARCTQIAAQPDVRASVADALRHAATALKLKQMAPLYELQEAADFDDEPHPLGTGAARLVTRPCAIVRGTLSFPVGAGVAPLPDNREGGTFTNDAALAQAMGKTAVSTSKLRNSLRRQGLPSNVYVAPHPSELVFCSAPTDAKGMPLPLPDPKAQLERAAGGKAQGDKMAVAAAPTPAPAPAPAPDQAPCPDKDRPPGGIAETPCDYTPATSEQVTHHMYGNDTFLRIINRLIVAAAAHKVSGSGDDNDPPDPVAAFLDASKSKRDGGGAVNPQTRREGLWAEMQRHVAISQDRLWVFVRLLSGKIGGNVSEVITLADEATLKAAKAIQEQRLEISRRVSDMQSKIVETVVASMLKNSHMTMEYVQKDNSLAVIDAEARKNLKDLSTGASGRPFFEANVALKNLTEKDKGTPPLKDVLSGLANVGMQMQATLEQTLADPSAASASLVELSHPANSYFVSMRADALAAIRTAQEKLNCELGAVGGRRRLMLWELIEGGCVALVDRFAELCGYLLVQSRTATGVSAMYVSHQSIYTNASQARVALSKLVAAALTYLNRVPAPSFERKDTKEARFEALTQGERVRDIDITARQLPLPRAPLFAPYSDSGYVVVGGRRRT